jgi:hypothetical protein
VQTVRLFPEFRCYPIWILGVDGLWKNIPPTELPVTADLANELTQWSDRFDRLFVSGPSSSIGFESEQEDEEYFEWGAALARRLEVELGTAYSVSYEYEPG